MTLDSFVSDDISSAKASSVYPSTIPAAIVGDSGSFIWNRNIPM